MIAIHDIVDAVSAKSLSNNEIMNKRQIEYVFATDLMSDALAMIQNDNESTILVTGLANPQSLRTAEMLDIKCILYVRAKKLSDDLIALANEMGISVYSSDYTMYETCGRLYELNLKPLRNE